MATSTARITADELKEIVEAGDRDVSIFIETAALVVSEDLVGSGLTAARLRIIELYLAAHFFALTEERGGLIRSSTGDAADTYADTFGQSFNSTRYGQHAISLDTTGALANVGIGGAKSEFRVV